MHNDDSDLVAHVVRDRDERAFGMLYERHTLYLYRLALRLTAGEESEAEDIVHEAWIRAVHRMATFQGRSSLRTWLAGIVVNAWRERQRTSQRSEPLDDTVFAAAATAPEPLDRIDVERALAALPPGYREVLVLHDVEGYTHEDIASLLGVDAGTSRSQLSRARAAMRRALRTSD